LRDSYEALKRYGEIKDYAKIQYNWTLQLKKIILDLNMEELWIKQCPNEIKKNKEELLKRLEAKLKDQDCEKAINSTSVPHLQNIMNLEEEPKYHQLNLPISIVSTIMQMRLSFNRISIHNKTLNLKGWFYDDDGGGRCPRCSENILEDFEHFMEHCNDLSQTNNFELKNYKKKEFYETLSHDSCLQIYNIIIKYFYERYQDF